MPTGNIFLELRVTTKTNFNQTFFDVKKDDKKSGKLETRKQYVKAENGNWRQVPVISSNSLRGRLRRILVKDIVLPALLAKGYKTDAITASWMMHGGHGASSQGDIEMMHCLAKNPVTSLMGGGLSLASKVDVLTLMPQDIENTKFFVEDIGLLKIDELVQKDKSFDFIDDNSLIEYRQKDVDTKKGKNSNANSDDSQNSENLKKTSGNLPFVIEAVKAGVSFCGDINIKNASDVELGLLLMALEILITQKLGGLHSRGFGIVDWEIFVATESESIKILDIKSDGVFLHKKTIQNNLKSCGIPYIQKALDAANEFLKNISGESIRIIKPKKDVEDEIEVIAQKYELGKKLSKAEQKKYDAHLATVANQDKPQQNGLFDSEEIGED